MENRINKTVGEIAEELMDKHAKSTLTLIEMSKLIGKDSQELACKAGLSLFLTEFMDTMSEKMASEN